MDDGIKYLLRKVNLLCGIILREVCYLIFFVSVYCLYILSIFILNWIIDWLLGNKLLEEKVKDIMNLNNIRDEFFIYEDCLKMIYL